MVRSAPLIRARGRLERRERVISVLAFDLDALRWSEPAAEVRRIDPGKDGGEDREELAARHRELAVADLRAVVPVGHAFSRRGR